MPMTQPGDGRSSATSARPHDADPAGGTGAHVAQTIDPAADGCRTIVLTMDADASAAPIGSDPSILDGGLDTHWVVPERRSRRFDRADGIPSSRPARAAAEPRSAAARPAPTARPDRTVPSGASSAEPSLRRRTARRPEPFETPARRARRATSPSTAPADFSPAPVESLGALDAATATSTAATPVSAESRVADWSELTQHVIAGDDWLGTSTDAWRDASALEAGADVAEAPPQVARDARRGGGAGTRASAGRAAHRARATSGPEGRRTVQIGGTSTVPGIPRLVELERRRPARRPMERLSERPDRIALWAVLLGVFLILVAATSGHAAV